MEFDGGIFCFYISICVCKGFQCLGRNSGKFSEREFVNNAVLRLVLLHIGGVVSGATELKPF
jgi:hypothetical protein